jgi:hypothetical protein
MNQKVQNKPIFDGAVFGDNQKRLSRDVYLQHLNKHVAWSLDGSQIVASADTLEGLMAEMDHLSLEISEVVLDYIPDPSESGC